LSGLGSPTDDSLETCVGEGVPPAATLARKTRPPEIQIAECGCSPDTAPVAAA